VLSDPVFLRRIIQNLMSNAIRYTISGGVVVTCSRQDGQLVISSGYWNPCHSRSSAGRPKPPKARDTWLLLLLPTRNKPSKH
jgi:hypothetical protein